MDHNEAKNINDDEVLTEEQVAVLLGVTVRAIQVWRRKSEGPPAFRISPKKIRYWKSEVMHWVWERRR